MGTLYMVELITNDINLMSKIMSVILKLNSMAPKTWSYGWRGYEDTSFKGEDSRVEGGRNWFFRTMYVREAEESHFCEVREDTQGS